tara:strand:+ start:1123 stop:1920 length:798 start_codon:yes stop_codon:yes gene_type:complete
MANGFFQKGPKRNKRGIYEVRRGFDRSPSARKPGGGILGGIGRAIKGLVGATPQGDARREERQMRRKIRRNLRNPQPTEAGMSTKGLSRGDARRLARTMAPQAIESQKKERLAENRRKRAFKEEKANNKPISLDKRSGQPEKSTSMPKPKGYKPSSPSQVNRKSKDNVYEYTDRSGKTTSYDPTKKKSNKNSMIAEDYTRISRGGIYGKTSLQQQKAKYQERAKGNVAAMAKAKKAGKETFEYINPRTGEKRTIKTSNYRVGRYT